jgi:16S rRNA (uracil1498-N3)-methyltransferase
MRPHRFFIEEKLEGKQKLTITRKDLIHQWKNVFRLQSGDKVILLDHTGYEFSFKICSISNKDVDIELIDVTQNNNVSHREIWLFASLIKKDNFEWILEKGTELGISHFVPILSERSEKKGLNIERAKKIIKEAAEQSGRATLPELHDIVSLEDAVSSQNSIHLVCFSPTGEKFEMKNFDQFKKLGFFIGPEGGWSEKELEFFKEKKVPTYSLGTQILRAETAAIAVSSLLLL